MHRSPARRLLGVVCGFIAVASIAMVVPVAVAEPGWSTRPAAPAAAAAPAFVQPAGSVTTSGLHRSPTAASLAV